MKKYPIIRFHQKIFSLVMVFALILSLVPANLAFADANKLFITPTTSQMNLNTVFTVNVRSYADTDQSVGSANGSVTYPSGQLRVTAISVSGSGYGSPTISQGAGTIGFNASRNPAPSGSTQIFAVTFQAIGAGTAQVGFASNSLVNNAVTTYTNGSYTIINPNPTTPQPTTTPKSTPVTPKPKPVIISTTPSPSPTPQPENPQPTPDPTGLVDNVSLNPLYTSSTVTWTVNGESPSATIAYGTSSTKLDKEAAPKRNADGTFTATLGSLTPGVRYIFIITANAAGGKTGSYSGVIPTRGFPVTVNVTENNVPVESGLIKIANQSVPIKSGGKATLGLAAGSYTGTITTDTADPLSINLTVESKTIPTDGSAPESQSFSFNLNSSVLEQGPGSGFSLFAFIGILLAGTFVLVVGFVGFMAYRRRQFELDGSGGSSASGSSVIIDDGYDWRAQESAAEHPSVPSTAVTNPQMSIEQPVHHNSVYLNEEEPVDMFASLDEHVPSTPQGTAASSIVPPVTPQNPNLPHSTTP